MKVRSMGPVSVKPISNVRRPAAVSRPGTPFVVVGLGEVLWDLLPGGKQLGGAPANFACHARRLGAEGVVASCVGDDADGREVVDRLRAMGLSSRYVAVDPTRPTGRVSVRLDAHGVPDYVIHENAAWDYIPPAGGLLGLAGRAGAVCFGSLGQRGPVSRSTIRHFLSATRPDCLRVCDINLRQGYYGRDVVHQLLLRSSVLKLNDQELPVVAGLLGVDDRGDEAEAARAVLWRYGLRMVAVTRGGRGSLLVTADQVSAR